MALDDSPIPDTFFVVAAAMTAAMASLAVYLLGASIASSVRRIGRHILRRSPLSHHRWMRRPPDDPEVPAG